MVLTKEVEEIILVVFHRLTACVHVVSLSELVLSACRRPRTSRWPRPPRPTKPTGTRAVPAHPHLCHRNPHQRAASAPLDPWSVSAALHQSDFWLMSSVLLLLTFLIDVSGNYGISQWHSALVMPQWLVESHWLCRKMSSLKSWVDKKKKPLRNHFWCCHQSVCSWPSHL